MTLRELAEGAVVAAGTLGLVAIGVALFYGVFLA